MRKYFLLIVYISSLLFLQQRLSAGLSLAVSKDHKQTIVLPIFKTNHFDCNDDRYCESSFCSASLNVEEDENSRSKLLPAFISSYLQADHYFIIEIHPVKYLDLVRPYYVRDVLKFARALRL